MRNVIRLSCLLILVVASAASAVPQGTVTALTIAPTPADVGATVRATATGSGELCGAVNIDWGDGTAITYATSRLPVTQTHVYKAGGTFTVRAQGMGNCGGEATTRIVVKGPPAQPAAPPDAPRLTAVALAASPIEPRTAASITLEGSGICQLTLDFGDGNSTVIHEAMPKTVRHTYALPGRYAIVATPVAPCAERRAATLEVGVRPAQRISGIDVAVPPGAAATTRSFTIQGSGRCTYVIDFGDGNNETRDAALPDVVRHNYPANGRYTVEVTPRPSCSGVQRATFVVGSNGPGAITRVDVRPANARIGEQVTVIVGGSGTCKVVVDFDDGRSRTFTERLPYRLAYRYAVPGAYNIVAWTDEPCTGEGDSTVRIRSR
jgi:hypothetical protein